MSLFLHASSGNPATLQYLRSRLLIPALPVQKYTEMADIWMIYIYQSFKDHLIKSHT